MYIVYEYKAILNLFLLQILQGFLWSYFSNLSSYIVSKTGIMQDIRDDMIIIDFVLSKGVVHPTTILYQHFFYS